MKTKISKQVAGEYILEKDGFSIGLTNHNIDLMKEALKIAEKKLKEKYETNY